MTRADILGGWEKHRLIEWGFIAALLMICVGLTTLQSRWTRDLGRATTRQQSVQVRSQAELLCQTFDSELNEACQQLRPSADQIESVGRAQAHAGALRRWQADHPRPMFSRLAVVVPETGIARLYFLDQKSAGLTPGQWPQEWAVLHRNLSGRVAGTMPPPFDDLSGVLREYPLFGGQGPDGPDGPGEIEWMVFELDQNYIRQTWLPELSRTFLNPGRETVTNVVVRTMASPPATVFSTGERWIPRTDNLVAIDFNSRARGGRDDPDAGQDQFWTLYAWPRAGEFAAAVSSARSHDLALALALDVCLLVCGLLIIYYARRARRLGDARMQFVATVSHELRTPLTVIRAAGQNLRRGIVRDPARLDKYAEMIVEHSGNLAEMVEQVLAFSGAKRNESVLVNKPVAIAQVLREAIAACAPDTEAVGCKVQETIEPDLPPVFGDPHALLRVFQNLLTNAARHGGQGEWIGATARYRKGSSSGHIEVEIADRGVGIPTREQAHVFEPFFRGLHARDQHIRGSGIGLSVVREIVGIHHGSIGVQSQPGKGTIFTVRLPVTKL